MIINTLAKTKRSLSYYRVFSGIQPTGIPHLGNYFGAIAEWIRLANERKISSLLQKYAYDETKEEKVDCDTPIYSIVDIHAYTSNSSQFGQQLYDNILSTTAALLALGLDAQKCILFRQSDILEHNYLDNVFDNFVSPNRLTHMTQFKDKSKEQSAKLITNGLLNYPILQAADILLYRANLIPVGEDQVQHIELTRDIAKKFNTTTSSKIFPIPEPILSSSEHARRIKSLRNPDKKMSKSDTDKKSFIEVTDEPDIIMDKCKKALTDCESEIYYDAEKRPGISNLMRIYNLVTGDSFEKIRDQYCGVESAKFKLILGEILIEKFSDTRREYKHLRADQDYLESVLALGASKARPLAEDTINQVKHLLGSIRLKSA